MRARIIAGLILCTAVIGGLLYLAGRPPSRDAVLAQARAEGEVRVYGNGDRAAVAPLIAAFERRYPALDVRYHELDSGEVYRRFVNETGAGAPSADLVWSSAMDWQAKLINDGYAQAYASPEKAALPEQAVWKDTGYGITVEPVAFVYNKQLIAPEQAPRTHEALERLLRERREALTGMVATYDPARSDVGYLYLTQDFAATRDTRSLLSAIAATRPQLSATTAPMVDAVAAGRAAIAYNVVGPYALERAAADDRLGVIFPQDYTIVASRVAFIAREARHPAAARLFLDFMLSREGQTLLARAWLPPVRTGLPGHSSMRLDPEQARPIGGGPQLFVNLDPIKRRRFLGEWSAILSEGATIQ